MSRFAWFLLVGFVLGLTLAACGGGTSNTCNASTCGGCCDADGKCQPGTTATACGEDGASCGRCGTGTVCTAGTCQAGNTGGGTGGGSGGGTGGGSGGGTGGGSGGGTGGGAGGGSGGGTGGGAGGGSGGGTGGGSGGCRQVSTFSTAATLIANYWAFSSSPGHYNVARFMQPSGSAADGLGIEVVYPNDVGPTAPFTWTINSDTYFQCSVCSVYYEDCDMQLNCSRTYLARSGSVNIQRADKAPAGRMVGSAMNLRFVEWDFQADRPMADGGCVEVTTLQPFNVGWNQDGGMPPP